jgi:hypothetical protein
MKTNTIDPDISALNDCVHALDRSSSRRMLEANLRFLWDRYLGHPSEQLPGHLKPDTAEKKRDAKEEKIRGITTYPWLA